MSGQDNSHRTQITIALIGLAGVLGGGLIANWDKVFSPELESTSAVSHPASTALSPVSIDQRIEITPLNHAAPRPGVIAQGNPILTGAYVGISTEGTTQSPIQIIFTCHGESVTGTYTQNGMMGTMYGTVSGNTLTYEWSMGGYTGKGVSIFQGNQYQGTWGYGNSVNNGGTTFGQAE